MMKPADERVFSCGAADRFQWAVRVAGARQCPHPMPGDGQSARPRESRMTENMMVSDAGADTSSEILDEVLSEPENQNGSGPENMESREGETGQNGEAERGERMVPLATFLGMRDEAKASRAENAELRHMLAIMQHGDVPSQDMGIPDPASDSVGHSQYMAMLESQMAQMEAQQAYEQLGYVESSLEAAKEHLGESFAEAYEVARANPHVARHILNHPNPGGALVEFHHQLQRQKIVEQIPPGVPLDDWIIQQAERLPRQWPGVAYQTSHIAAPPPSLAGARGGNASAMAHVVSDDPVDDILK